MDVRADGAGRSGRQGERAADAGRADQPRRDQRHARRRSCARPRPPGSSSRSSAPVNTVRGTYDFQGRRFEILRDGTIRFDGEPLERAWIRCSTSAHAGMIQGVEARVNVRGTLKQPDIVLSSTPPLEQADILSLIVFNQPINSLGEGSRSRSRSARSSWRPARWPAQLASSIGNALGVDTFEISTAPEAAADALGDDRPAGRPEPLRQGASRGSAAQSQTNFILEHELTRWLRLRTNVLQGYATQQSLFQRVQGSGADLLFFFSY